MLFKISRAHRASRNLLSRRELGCARAPGSTRESFGREREFAPELLAAAAASAPAKDKARRGESDGARQPNRADGTDCRTARTDK